MANGANREKVRALSSLREAASAEFEMIQLQAGVPDRIRFLQLHALAAISTGCEDQLLVLASKAPDDSDTLDGSDSAESSEE